MAFLQQGSSAQVAIAAGQSIAVGAVRGATANVTFPVGYAKGPSDTVVNGTETFGPFATATTVTVYAAQGTAEYVTGTSPVCTDGPVALATDPLTGVATGLVSPTGAVNSIFQPSSKYKFFIPGQQFIGSGNAKDKSGNAADAVLQAGLSDAAAWANPGYITTVAGVNGHAAIPVAKFSFDLATQSVILSFRVKKVATAGTEYLCGFGDTGSTRGILVSYRPLASSVSKVRVVINTAGGVYTSADSTATFGEAVATDHVLTLAVDGVTKSASLYCDGTLSDTYTNAVLGATTLATAFGLGTNQGGVGATAYAGQYSGLHMLVMTGGLPTNIGIVAQKLAAMPNMYLTDSDLVF